jgi:AcrR family transcriptional regulator
VSPSRRAETSAESRARILAAAGELLAERGLRATTVNEVAERAGISHTSVSWHFGSKDGLAGAVTESAFAQVCARFAELGAQEGPRTVARLLDAHREMTASQAGRVFARILPEVVVHDGPLREIYIQGYRSLRELATEYLAPVVAASGAKRPEAIASAVFASGAGVNLLRGLLAGTSRRAGFELVAEVFERAVAPAPPCRQSRRQSRNATARAGAALRPTNRSGKTPNVKPVAGN